MLFSGSVPISCILFFRKPFTVRTPLRFHPYNMRALLNLFRLCFPNGANVGVNTETQHDANPHSSPTPLDAPTLQSMELSTLLGAADLDRRSTQSSQDIDPILAPILQNLSQSRLCQLPSELLLEIMEHLDWVGLACLRRTSRIFLRLFSSAAFREYHGRRLSRLPDFVLQNRYDSQAKQLFQELRLLLNKDAMCAPCFHVYENLTQDARVKALARRRLFCDGCREFHPAGYFSLKQRRKWLLKVCLAYEGRIRVCQHATLHWQDVTRWIAEARSRGQKEMSILLCEDHASTCGKERFQGIWAKIIFSTLGKNLETVKVVVEWLVHIDMPPASPTSQGRYPASQMRRVLEMLYKDAGQFLFPETDSSLSRRMAAFDPNYCSCLHYEGQRYDEQPIDSALQLPNTRKAFHHFHEARISAGASLEVRPCSRSSDSPALHFIDKSTIPLLPGFRGPSPRPSGRWYNRLDTISYDLSADHESCHVLWCPNQECINYCSGQRNLFRITPLLRFAVRLIPPR